MKSRHQLIPNCRQCEQPVFERRKNDEDHKNVFCSPTCSRLFKRKAKNRPSAEEVLRLVESGTSYVALGKMYGVSDNAVRKWVRTAGLKNVKLKGETQPVPCSFCGKTIEKWASELKRGHPCCSAECQRNLQRRRGKLGKYSFSEIKQMVEDYGLRGAARQLDVNHSTIQKKLDAKNPVDQEMTFNN